MKQKEKMMLYPKNVPNIERLLRVALALSLVGLLLFGQGLIGSPSPLIIGILLFTAVFMVVTGFVGWCPACAMVGRKIKTKSQNKPS
jgi:hypothetical protein